MTVASAVTVASAISPITTGLGIVVLLALLVALIGIEVSRQRTARPAPSALVRLSALLGAVLAVDIVARFVFLTHGH